MKINKLGTIWGVWCANRGQKVCLNIAKKDQLCAINLKYWWHFRQQPSFFKKQDLTFKQAHRVSFCLVLCNEPKFWQWTLVFSAFYRLYLEIALSCKKPKAQNFLLSRDEFFSLIASQHFWSLITLGFRNFSLILFKVEMLASGKLLQK